MASVYAQQVMKFSTADSIKLIICVNITAAAGAFIFGFLQDKFGSVRTLLLALGLWVVAITLTLLSESRASFWIAAIIIGSAMGATGSAGRALVARFAPGKRCGEFLGLWGLAMKLATACGTMIFGAIVAATNSNFKMALGFDIVFFVAGAIVLLFVKEERGIKAAQDADGYASDIARASLAP